MREGDCVYFKQPFQPNPAIPKTYQQGIIAAIVTSESTDRVTDVIVRLYDPNRDAIHVDEDGSSALYSFQRDELDW
ncbi:MAG: hypothetical protein F6K30_25855 [Cyanothece sp. SIO2G6]|nr:hypothetical protein [Cyanothece sp. SIO2G6]